MSGFRFCVASDLHIRQQGRIFKSRSKPFGDSIFSLRQISEYLNSHPDIKLLILSGDLFDYRQLDSSSLDIFDNFLKELKFIDTIFYVQGQHDFSTPPWLSVIRDSRLKHLSMQEPIEFSGYYFYGSDYTGQINELYSALDCIPIDDTPKILVLHETWKFAENFPFFSITRNDIKLIICGDIHSCEIFSLPNGGMFLSPGCIAPNTIAETSPMYFHIVTAEKDKVVIDSVLLKTRPIYRFEVNNEDDKEAVLNYNYATGLPDDLAFPLIVIYCNSGSLLMDLRENLKQPYVYFKANPISRKSVENQSSVNVRDVYNIRQFFIHSFGDTGNIAGLLYDSIGKTDKASLSSAIRALYQYWNRKTNNVGL